MTFRPAVAFVRRTRRDRPRSRRALVGAAALAAAVLVAPGLARSETIKDSTGRTLTMPAAVAHVVPAGVPAQVLLQVLAPGKLVGLVEPFKPEHMIYVGPALAGLPQVPVLTRTTAAGDVADVVALKPDVVVDYGKVSARYTAADELIGKELKVPAVLFDGSLSRAPAVLRVLGHALGVASRGEAVAGMVSGVLDRVGPVSALAEADRVKVYLARGADGLDAARGGTSFDEAIRLAGGRNVVTGTGPTFRRMSVEAVVALKPAVVIVADPQALVAPLRAALPKDVTVVLDAGEPYPVLTGPPSLNRIVGVAALAAILHPGAIKPDRDAATRLEADLFAFPAGMAVPAPLQIKD